MSGQPPDPDSQVQRFVRLVATSVVPSLLAVVAVAAVITALYVWHQDTTAATQTLQTSTADNQRAAMTPPSPTPTLAVTATTSATSTVTPAPSTSPSTSPPARPSPRQASPKPAKRLSVVVLNQTRRTGLARVVASRVSGRGWTVASVGNFRGNVPATTIYYPAGAGAQATELAKELPLYVRTRPVIGNLSTSRLTLVLTDDYPRQQ